MQEAEKRTSQPVPPEQVQSAIAVISKRIADDGLIVRNPERYYAEAIRNEPDVYGLLLAGRLAEITAEDTGPPPWCGDCDEQTRQLDRYGDSPKHCPDCHPAETTRRPA